MKTFRLTAMLLSLLTALTAQAQLTFTTNNETISITGYTGNPSTVVIPSATNGFPVVNIETNAFYQSPYLGIVFIPSSVTNIGSHAFEFSTVLGYLFLSNGLVSIGEAAFFQTKLEDLFIPDSVTTIGDSAFATCNTLTNVVIGAQLTNLGSGTLTSSPFSECRAMKAFSVSALNSSFSSLDGVLFDKNQTTLIQYPGKKPGDYTVPETVRSIGNDAFGISGGFSRLTIPETVTNIEFWAFYKCTNLSSVTLPQNITTLRTGLFQSCSRLTNFIIPSNVTTIMPEVFESCSSLTSIVVPASVSSIDDAAFRNCARLTAIVVDPANPAYCSVDGVLYDRNTNILIQCPAGKTGTYSIPGTVTNISSWAFSYCGKLTGVIVPESVVSIGADAFGFANLTQVYFAGDAPVLGSSVFTGTKATIYYMPGAAGWDSSFGGRPTVCWNPEAQSGSFGVQTNQFGFKIIGSSNLLLVVEASSDLSNPVWVPVATNSLNTFIGTNGASYFTDPDWTNYSTRYYRFRSP